MTSKTAFRLITLVVFCAAQLSFSQHKQAYQLYNSNGQNLDYKKMIDSLATADVVLFGEFHNNAIAHWLQIEVTKDLHQNNLNMVLGAEMFEADQQPAIDAYLSKALNVKQLKDSIKLWPNFKTDYKPLLDFAQQNELDFIATNIPRRFASNVYKKGGFSSLDSLTQQQLKWVAPRPILFDPELPGYKAMLEMMGDHASVDMVKAQAIKDATMAHFILKNTQANQVFLHFNGSYHSNNFDGIYWYLKQYQPEIKILTITTVEQAKIDQLNTEHQQLANFIICVDEDVTKTY